MMVVSSLHQSEIKKDKYGFEYYDHLTDGNSVGLNFISGFVRLELNEYEDSDGKERLESALVSVKQTFT